MTCGEHLVGAAWGHFLGSPEQNQSQGAKVRLSVHSTPALLPSVNTLWPWNQEADIMSFTVSKLELPSVVFNLLLRVNTQSYFWKRSIWVSPQLHIIWMLDLFVWSLDPHLFCFFTGVFLMGAPLSTHSPNICQSLTVLCCNICRYWEQNMIIDEYIRYGWTS